MADKKPVAPKILVTKDYDLFGFSDKDNRSITPAQVQQVGREIGWLVGRRSRIRRNRPIVVVVILVLI